MLRIFLLIIIILTGCSNGDRSTADHINQEQTEETSSEVSNEPESNTASEEEANVARQLPENQSGFFSTILNFILWGLIIVLTGGLTIVIYLKRKEYREQISQLEKRVDYYSNQCQEKDLRLRKVSNHYQSIREELKKEKRDREELEVAVSKLQAKSITKGIDGSNAKISKDEAEVRITENKKTKVDTTQEELFFELPSEYGKFKHGSGVSSLEERRLYKLTYKREESEGEIEFISGNYDGIAINHKDSMIKPACSIIKENENNPSSVHQISPGTVKRDGEEWIIENKIKVEIR